MCGYKSVFRMVEIMEIANENEAPIGKIEDDRSFQRRDSGVNDSEDTSAQSLTQSGGPTQSSGYNTHSDGHSIETESSWLKVKNEVVDPISFDPPLACSSNVGSKGKICDLSSIENMGLVPKFRKGNTHGFSVIMI